MRWHVVLLIVVATAALPGSAHALTAKTCLERDNAWARTTNPIYDRWRAATDYQQRLQLSGASLARRGAAQVAATRRLVELGRKANATLPCSKIAIKARYYLIQIGFKASDMLSLFDTIKLANQTGDKTLRNISLNRVIKLDDQINALLHRYFAELEKL